MKRKALLLAVPIALIVATAASTPPRRIDRENLESQFPELQLVSKYKTYYRETDFLYTGRIDSEVLSDRLAKNLTGPGWEKSRRKFNSAFPYLNAYNSQAAIPWWARLPYLRTLVRRSSPRSSSFEVRVLKGRAGSRPDHGPWSSVLIREPILNFYPDMSEPIPGMGVQLQN